MIYNIKKLLIRNIDKILYEIYVDIIIINLLKFNIIITRPYIQINERISPN